MNASVDAFRRFQRHIDAARRTRIRVDISCRRRVRVRELCRSMSTSGEAASGEPNARECDRQFCM